MKREECRLVSKIRLIAVTRRRSPFRTEIRARRVGRRRRCGWCSLSSAITSWIPHYPSEKASLEIQCTNSEPLSGEKPIAPRKKTLGSLRQKRTYTMDPPPTVANIASHHSWLVSNGTSLHISKHGSRDWMLVSHNPNAGEREQRTNVVMADLRAFGCGCGCEGEQE
jgi:hypothetical protein